MIAANDFEAFRAANRREHRDLADFLLTQSLPCFMYAESHQHEYGATCITPFTARKLASLAEEKNRLTEQNPDAVLMLSEEDSKLCFYMLRNLIRRNTETLGDDILFLLDIPSVKNLAHTAVSPNQPNELLRLALDVNNRDAAEVLLAIPAVHALATEHDFYVNEQRHGIDVQALAADRESSMKALTQGEQQRLQALTQRYQSLLDKAGVAN
ncbi:hypothetical protein [uncultured Legionella sp.]|uniref:hypothetical protein n=1 Tax=uncultured Legionella sp. TaxID=210934 RepID=UPI002601E414|nr:hypothetical protein [uncultured Legionella sp.]